jgi:tetratricopeptide (TPR) repeat protein
MCQGGSEEAISLIDQVLANTKTEPARGRLLLKRANALEFGGRYDSAIEELRRAEIVIEHQREPRLRWAVHFNLAVNYCHLDLYQDAEFLLPLLETLREELNNDLDTIRLAWLKGRTWAGLGQSDKAAAILSKVRHYFLSEQIAYDFALASLELSTLNLQQGRTRIVEGLATEMLWIFRTQQLHAEARGAITAFCEAVERNQADAEWTRRLVKYLYRAQYNPCLRFCPVVDQEEGARLAPRPL